MKFTECFESVYEKRQKFTGECGIIIPAILSFFLLPVETSPALLPPGRGKNLSFFLCRAQPLEFFRGCAAFLSAF